MTCRCVAWLLRRDAFVAQALAGLTLVWVSHMHPDHHLGLPRLLLERAAIAQVCACVCGMCDCVVKTARVALTGVGLRCCAHQRRTLEPVIVVGPEALYHWLCELTQLHAELRTAFRFYDSSLFWRFGSVTSSAPPPAAAEPTAVRAASCTVSWTGIR